MGLWGTAAALDGKTANDTSDGQLYSFAKSYKYCSLTALDIKRFNTPLMNV
jgi:hypothetical protein